MVEVPGIVTAAQHGVPNGKNWKKFSRRSASGPRPSESVSQKHFLKACGRVLFQSVELGYLMQIPGFQASCRILSICCAPILFHMDLVVIGSQRESRL